MNETEGPRVSCWGAAGEGRRGNEPSGQKVSFGEAAVVVHLLNLNEKSPGWEISTLAGQHNPGKMV